MNRTARLQAAKQWLPTYTGRDPVIGYRKWYGVSSVCGILELRQLGIKIDEHRLEQARHTEEEIACKRDRKKRRRAEKPVAEEGLFVESDENFAYIAGYTEAGFAYGVKWEELEAESTQRKENALDGVLSDADGDDCDIPF